MTKKVIRSTLEGPLEKEEEYKMSGGRRCLHILLFLFLLANDVADFVSDWLFFADVKIAEKGLVYGPPDPIAVWLLLFFSIVGTVTFAIECVNLWWEFFRNNPWIDSDYLSAIVLWIEDIPQVAISLYIALCREEPISIFQLTKAAVILIGVVIRIVITSVKYCNKEAVRSHHHVKVKVVIMLGVLLEAFCAGAIFFFTQTEQTESGDVAFRVPNTVIEEVFNDQRYFAGVSVFLSLAGLFNGGALDTDKTDFVANWMRLSTLDHIRGSDGGETSFKIQYENTAGTGVYKMAVYEKQGADTNPTALWAMTECYSINQNTAKITRESNTTCAQANYFTSPTMFFIKFLYKAPGYIFKKKVFGDIDFNMKLQRPGGQCDPLNQYAESIEGSIGKNIDQTLRYYRVGETLDPVDTGHLLNDTPGAPRFYRNESPDLTDIFTVWKTGWLECDSTGNASPNLDNDLQLQCV